MFRNVHRKGSGSLDPWGPTQYNPKLLPKFSSQTELALGELQDPVREEVALAS